uniref:Kelch-like protein 17 n=1 Tax=Rhizophagus irregularis (strain DAOM 181602 / DAOM 197198 / MUCL 43194) TaxID=747089 RepID=U9U6I6_RHIID
MVDNKLLQNLSQNLLEILKDEVYYDITIEVGIDPYVKIYRAHMVILCYRSPYLRRILSTDKNYNDGSLKHIKLPNISPKTFQVILSGRIFLEEYDTLDIIKILVAGNELGLKELIDYIQSFLVEYETNWMELNFNEIYRISFENQSFFKLQKFCNDLISREPDKIFKSLNSPSIPEKLLVSLIQSDNLQMSGIKVWEHVLKWGLAKNPEFPSNPTDFSKEEFDTLRNSLQQCIPFIKFYNLTSDEFSNKVLPYKKILPRELYKDLLKHYLNSNNQMIKKFEPGVTREINKEIGGNNNIDSKIITSQHVELILKWIDMKNSNTITSIFTKLIYKDTEYKMKLLFRGSRDGFTIEKFHEICDNQSHTVIIIKVKGSKEILGGYNPITWKACGFTNTKDSFIFSFKRNDDIEDHILSRVVDKECAIINGDPSFGFCDLHLFGECYCRRMSYEKPIRETKDLFSCEEFEVFQITECD